MSKPEKLIENGIRLDGRKPDELRPIKIKVGVLNRADGSCYFEFGGNKVIAAVYGPREVHPRHMQKSTSAVVRYRYNMASFSVEERKRPGPDRRSIEVSKVSREALEPVIFHEYFPRSAIDIFVEVLQADAGTRTAGINAASIALADAGIPMKSLVSACAVGKVDDTLVLDLNKDEDNYGQADMPIAMTPDGKITLLQMDGHLTKEEFKEGLEMAKNGCLAIHEMQKAALIEKYSSQFDEPNAKIEGDVLE
jgi:exosome complex component RRP41